MGTYASQIPLPDFAAPLLIVFLLSHISYKIIYLIKHLFCKWNCLYSTTINIIYHFLKMLKKMYMSKTKIPEKKFKRLMKKDIYLTPDKCLKYKIAHAVD